MSLRTEIREQWPLAQEAFKADPGLRTFGFKYYAYHVMIDRRDKRFNQVSDRFYRVHGFPQATMNAQGERLS